MRKRTRMRLAYQPHSETYFWSYRGQQPEFNTAEWHIWCHGFATRDKAIDAYNEGVAN